jgi:hypothetical protein
VWIPRGWWDHFAGQEVGIIWGYKKLKGFVGNGIWYLVV